MNGKPAFVKLRCDLVKFSAEGMEDVQLKFMLITTSRELQTVEVMAEKVECHQAGIASLSWNSPYQQIVGKQ